MSTNLKAPTAEEVKALRGMEFTYVFTEENGKEISGETTDAYVAQADINVGITIMGKIPERFAEEFGVEDPNKDVVLQCCNSYGDIDDNYIKYLWNYINLINSGYFKEHNNGVTAGGKADHMSKSCGFS